MSLFILLFGLAVLVGGSLHALLLYVIWVGLPEGERLSGMLGTIGLSLMVGIATALSFYDSHGIKTGNILVLPLTAVAIFFSTGVIGASAIVLSHRRQEKTDRFR